MWVYALPKAVRHLRLRAFLRDLKGADNLLEWPGDPETRWGQYRALAEIAGLAIRRRTSLQQASTRDIEWDGEGLLEEFSDDLPNPTIKLT